MCLFLCGTHCPLLVLLISAYFSSLKKYAKNTLTPLVSFCSETKTNLSLLCKISRVGHL